MPATISRDEILQGLIGILKKYEGRAANHKPLTESTSLVDELDIDSARMVDIMLDLEDKFNVSIDDSKVPKLPTVRDIVDILEGLVNTSKA